MMKTATSKIDKARSYIDKARQELDKKIPNFERVKRLAFAGLLLEQDDKPKSPKADYLRAKYYRELFPREILRAKEFLEDSYVKRNIAEVLYTLAELEANRTKKKKKAKPSDDRLILSYLRKAREKGCPRASYALANLGLHGKFQGTQAEIVSLLKEAAEQGLPTALYDLAILYETGNGVAKDDETALRYYLKAALGGDVQSVYEVGRCYYHGIGVTEDKQMAEVWFEHARELGVYE